MWEFKKEAICPQDVKSVKRYPEYKGYYKVKYNLAYVQEPSTILEIGVRAGYSAYSFLSACPDAKYTGIDAENGTHGGQGGPWMWWAKELLEDYDTTFIEADSQKMHRIDGGPFDFIHIDGDHTKEGLLHDLKICWPVLAEGGVIIVDDYDYIKTVKEGVDEFANLPGVVKKYVKSLRGEIIFSKK